MILMNASQERKKQDNSDGSVSVDGGVCVVFAFGTFRFKFFDELFGLRIITIR